MYDDSNNKRMDLSAAFGLALLYNDFLLFGGYGMDLVDLITATM